MQFNGNLINEQSMALKSLMFAKEIAGALNHHSAKSIS